MKKSLSIILALAMLLGLLPTAFITASAATTESYGLSVAGVPVTDANKDDILGDGAFSFSPLVNELFIYKDYNYAGDKLIDNWGGDLIIYTTAFDPTLSASGVVINSSKDVKLMGPGMLTLHSDYSSCVHAEAKVKITLSKARITVGGKYGFTGTNGPTNEKIVFDRSFLDGMTDEGSVYGFRGGVTITGCDLLAPTHAAVREGSIVAGNGTSPASWVTIAIEYDLWIAGFRVNNGNAPDVTGDGVFEFDADTNVLTIRGNFDFTYADAGDKLIYSDIRDGLKINVTRDSKLTTDCSYAIKSDRDLTITGTGKLTVESTYDCIYMPWGSTLTIDHANLDLTTCNYAIWGNSRTGPSLVVIESTVRMHSDRGAIYDFRDITLTDCEITYPYFPRIRDGAVRDSEGNVENDVTIEPKVVYGFTVAGVEVTSLNMKHILGGNNIDATYSPLTNELILRGDIRYDGVVIRNDSCEGLTIYTVGDVTLTGKSNASDIVAFVDTRIAGPGKLSLVGGQIGINVKDGATLTVDETELGIAASGYGIYGNDTASVEFKYCTVTAASADCAVRSFSSITLDGCGIDQPSYGRVLNGNIVGGDNSPAKAVSIIGKYNLWICGVQVTTLNKDDFSGTFSYDARNKTLFIYKGATVNGQTMIRAGVPGLTIQAPDEFCELRADGAGNAALVVEADTTIKGTGALQLRGEEIGIRVSKGATLTFDKAYVNVWGGGEGIEGLNSEKLVIKDSWVSSKSPYAVLNFKSITLENSNILRPAGGKIVDGSVFNEDNSYADDVAFEPRGFNVWVSGRQVNTRNKDDVYGDGTVRFYEAGEYEPSALDLEYGLDALWFRSTPVLVLDNYKPTGLRGEGWHEDGDCSAQLYLDEDSIFVLLKGENVLPYGCGDDEDAYHPHGIYTGCEDYVYFIGDGSLSVNADYYERYGLYGKSCNLYFWEEVDITLKGSMGLWNSWGGGDTPWLYLEDNAKLTCIAYQTSAGYNYSALECDTVEMHHHSELLAYTSFNGQALDTYGSVRFNSDYYDIKILKKGEYLPGSVYSTQKDPYKPGAGINMDGGVRESECRYVSIKCVSTYATSAAFINDSYTVTPQRNDVYAGVQLRPFGAPDIYDDGIVFESSDPSIVSFTPGKSSRVIYLHGWQNGTVTVTATVPGGATATCTVTASGFENEPKPISEIRVNGYHNPIIGEKARDNIDGISLPSGAGYEFDELFWYDSYYDEVMSPGEVFEEELPHFRSPGRYQLCMWFVAKEGYVFNPYALPEITMPGYDAEITDVELYDGVLYVLTDYMAAEQPYRETITSVQINGFERPKAGETAISNILKLSVPSNAPYTISDVEWVTYDTPHELRDGGGFFSAHVLDNHETFEDGELYWLRVYLTPKEGYRFDYDEIEQVKGIPYVNGWVEDDGSVFCAVTSNFTIGAFMYGDMDFDGEITVADALRALRIAAKLVKATDEDMLTGDVDGDDAITVADALKILRVAAKLADRDSLDPRGPR